MHFLKKLVSWVKCTKIVFTTVAWPFLIVSRLFMIWSKSRWITGFCSTRDCSCLSLALILVIGQCLVEKYNNKKKRKYKHVYSVGTYSLETLFCLGPAQSCGGTENQSLSDDLSANYSAYSHGPLTNVAPKRRTVINFSWISWCKISLVCCLQNTRNSILWKYINIGTV